MRTRWDRIEKVKEKEKKLYFVQKNCSDLVSENIVLVIEKNTVMKKILGLKQFPSIKTIFMFLDQD